MAGLYRGVIPIIDDATGEDFFRPEGAGFGCVPRDYDSDPVEMGASPAEMSTIPESEWDARYDEDEETKSSLEHLYLPDPKGPPAFVNLDQDGHGFCWSYSTGHALMLDQLKKHQPVTRLNPHSVASIIKNGRDEGGWCGLSLKFAREHGMAPEGDGPGEWPLHSRDVRLDTPAMRESMSRFRVQEDYYDLGRKEWDQKLTRSQLATCGFLNIPAPSDFLWWAHSVCQIRWVRIERGSWGPLILNSWKGWGRFGLAVLQGSKATANNAVAVRRSGS